MQKPDVHEQAYSRLVRWLWIVFCVKLLALNRRSRKRMRLKLISLDFASRLFLQSFLPRCVNCLSIDVNDS